MEVKAGGQFKQVKGNTTVTAGRWYHVVGTYDRANVRLYVDGVEDKSPTASTDALDTNDFDVEIGSHLENTGNRYFNGTIDDVRIYNRALSQDEIKRLYNMGHIN